MAHGAGRLVIRLFAVVERCENFLDIVVAEALGVQRIDVRDLHGRLRDRAGLIHAEHVHMGQRLDAVHILHEHALARELQAAGRDGDARQQVKALRDHADQGRDRGFHGVAQRQALEHGQEMTQEQDDAERDERDADDRDELCQGEHHLGLCRADIAPRLGRQLCRIALRADMRQLHAGAAGDHKAAGLQRVARIFQNGVGLAGDQGLVHLHLSGIRADLVARRKFHDVIADKLICTHGDALAGADGLSRSCRDKRQLIDSALSADLLKAADDCVSRSDEQEHQIFERADKAQAQRQHQEDQVEEGQDILLDDLPLGLRIGRRHNVAQAVALPELGLLRRKALCRVCLQHRDLAINARIRLLGFLFHNSPSNQHFLRSL